MVDRPGADLEQKLERSKAGKGANNQVPNQDSVDDMITTERKQLNDPDLEEVQRKIAHLMKILDRLKAEREKLLE
jgi:hypothetical protein